MELYNDVDASIKTLLIILPTFIYFEDSYVEIFWSFAFLPRIVFVLDEKLFS